MSGLREPAGGLLDGRQFEVLGAVGVVLHFEVAGVRFEEPIGVGVPTIRPLGSCEGDELVEDGPVALDRCRPGAAGEAGLADVLEV